MSRFPPGSGTARHDRGRDQGRWTIRRLGCIVVLMSGPVDTFPTKWWTRLDDGRVRCDVCPRECKMHDGQRGLCFVRACEGGEIVLTTYGR